MPDKPFYEIPSEAYLFLKPREDGSFPPEEEVRQWAAHELMRVYGYRVNMMTFEHPVKVGSVTKRIDILITRDEVPFIVVECKRRNLKGKGVGKSGKRKSLEQAISYADAQTIKAEFAVFTDGDAWKVRRKIGHGWVGVIDIPKLVAYEEPREMDLLFDTCEKPAALIHRLFDKVEGREARVYFWVMQAFFGGTNLLTQHGNEQLNWMLDNLLRSIVHHQHEIGYVHDKFVYAYSELFKYGSQIGANWIHYPPLGNEHPFRHAATYQSDIARFLRASRNLDSGDRYQLELIASLLGYCRNLEKPMTKGFPPITEKIFQALRDLLNFYFVMEFNRSFPEPNDELGMNDFKGSGYYAWCKAFEDYDRD
ncbi:type I restriction enzyme HsdR N-terminal domain-containing protein [Cerasicoccus frondis]|uniref:type I restriction enzyme HsdR N-terminal domain-containing protein n=1 Tax=Cerasicoccus frondis TaxID=490090 RepID=UPI0028526AED|nr:type I restriction enzyme HsdR N-terminal domain-containing protein [Cerasicoccus frondis]